MIFRELERLKDAAVRLSRRSFLAFGVGSAVAAITAGTKRLFAEKHPRPSPNSLPPDAPVEYIVVGSGPGGGPLACNLAKAGHKVVLFEAGSDNPGFVDNFAAVPFFTTFTSESPVIKWDYFVRHYSDDAQQLRDFKYVADPTYGGKGVWYPRVGALGGCALHSFLVEVYPSNSDWEYIKEVTGDHSWEPEKMRRYFERFERCRYVVQKGEGNPSRHGFDGWQPTEIADPTIFKSDNNIIRILRSAVDELYKGMDKAARVIQQFFASELDMNDWRVLHGNKRQGIWNIPLFTKNGRRVGPRELILQTAAALPNNLIIKQNSLVTRVLFHGTTATGVEYLEGQHLYRADPNPPGTPSAANRMHASREVILSAGAFNSPQLLKLSGIGPRDELQQHGIPVIVDLPGVGENLQDRYEIGIVTEMDSNFITAMEQGCTFGQGVDPCYGTWLQGKGLYTGVGGVNALLWKSPAADAAHRPDPDIFMINAPTRFKGYYPGYSSTDIAVYPPNQATWVILKGHTLNRAGTVKLRSADPRDTPLINFHYFEEGSDEKMEDLWSVVDGIEFIRRMNVRIADISNGEAFPGPVVHTREQIAQFVRDEAWGHHASCTNKIGRREDPMAVVDTDFRVHGTRNLRVVDASVFPRIPGYYILTPIYMISEKASAVILADAE